MPNDQHHGQSATIIQNLKPSSPKFLLSPPIKVTKLLCDTFQVAYQKNQPPPNKFDHIRLITIGPSHYCEKVRWGLDLLENDSNSPIYYTEDAHPPLFHSFATLEASKGKASMTPMVVFDKNTNSNTIDTNTTQNFLTDSTTILKKLCPFLYHTENESLCKEIESLENYLDQNLGASVRCLIYYECFNNPKYHNYLIKSLCAHTSMIESFLFSRLFDVKKYGIMPSMSRSLKINKGNAQISEESIKSVFNSISNRLLVSKSTVGKENAPQEYILGTSNGFTAVDLTFASLAGILLLPKEMKNINFHETHLPPRLQSLRNELLNTVAGQHVFKMYEKHRFTLNPTPLSSGLKNSTTTPNMNKIVTLKTLPRNRFPYGAVFATTATLAAAMASVSFILEKNSRSKL